MTPRVGISAEDDAAIVAVRAEQIAREVVQVRREVEALRKYAAELGQHLDRVWDRVFPSSEGGS